MFHLPLLNVTMNELKTFAMIVFTGLATFLHPIAGNVFAVFFLIGANFIVGLTTSLIAHDEHFSWKKFRESFKELCVMIMIPVGIYILGVFQKNPSGAQWLVGLVVYAMIYFYGIRILRNLRALMVKGSVSWFVLDFIYSTLSLEILKGIPGIKEYMLRHKTEFNDVIIPDENTTEN